MAVTVAELSGVTVAVDVGATSIVAVALACSVGVAVSVAVDTGVSGVSVTVGVGDGARTWKSAIRSGAVMRRSPLTSAVWHTLPANSAVVSAPMSSLLTRTSQLVSPRSPWAATPSGVAKRTHDAAKIAINRRAATAVAGRRSRSPVLWLRIAIAPTGQPH